MKRDLHTSERAWQMTFPHRVMPHQDEWLASVLLRCDEANHWESGETFRYLLRSTDHPGFGPGSSLIVVPSSILTCFAQLLMISQECLLATTYSTELARLYASRDPHPGLLLGRRRSANLSLLRFRGRADQEMTPGLMFRICPLCMGQAHIIRRTVTLPHLNYCPLHQVAFQTHCICGRPLILFFQGRLPFTCFACGLHWAQLPCLQIPPDRVTLEYDLFALYEFFLTKGTYELKADILSRARRSMGRQHPLELELAHGQTKEVANVTMDLSLGYVVDILVSIGMSPKDISADGRDLLPPTTRG